MNFLTYILSPIFLPFSLLYLSIVKFRHFLYNRHFLKTSKVNAMVISVGNISVGGTGKTPIVIELCKGLKKLGFSSAVVTRGYKRKSKGLFVVSDGKELTSDIAKSGDEPYLIADNVAVPVICEADRVSGASYAINRFGSEYIVLDDGFQHRKIARDFDIVVIDSPRFLGNGLLLPFGILRDSVSRLGHCNLIILSKIENRVLAEKQIKSLKRFNRKIILSYFSGKYIINLKEQLTVNNLTNKRLYLFCGIGNPQAFFNSFANSKIIKKKGYSDHYNYTDQEILDNIAIAQKINADYIITTEKDYVKFPDYIKKRNDIHYLKLEADFFDLEHNQIDITSLITGMVQI